MKPYTSKRISHKTKVYLSSPLELHKNNYKKVEKISIQKLKWLKSLHLKKNRDKEQCFIIEGEKTVKECFKLIPEDIQLIACTMEHVDLIPQQLQDKCLIVTSKDLERMSKHKTPNKFLAVIHKPKTVTFNPEAKFLILDSIQDPGNLGSIVRTADWFGINQIVCSESCADLYNSKTLQATMGSFLRVDVIYKELIPFLEAHQFNISGAFLNGDPIKSNSLKNSHAIMLGNEGQGISEELEEFCNNPVKIVGQGGAESLNVSNAGSILMYEWTK